MFEYQTIWDVYEMKFVIFIISVGVALGLAKWLYNKDRNK